MLNGFQQKVAGAAILCLSVCAIGGFAIAALKIAGAFLDKFGAVVWPLALALILSFILKPAVDFMAVKMKVGRTAACWIMIAALALAAAGCLATAPPVALAAVLKKLPAYPSATETERFFNAPSLNDADFSAIISFSCGKCPESHADTRATKSGREAQSA